MNRPNLPNRPDTKFSCCFPMPCHGILLSWTHYTIDRFAAHCPIAWWVHAYPARQCAALVFNVDIHSFSVLSLCTGIGALDLGVKLAVPSTRTICMVEREGFCINDLVQAMEAGLMDEAPIFSDVRTFDGKPWRGVVDCVIGGYPCQPFSIAGKRLGASDPRHLWPAIAKIVDEVKPAYCFFENVDDHLRMGYKEVAQDLDAMGYIPEAGIFSSEETGASHARERLYIMAYSSECELAAGSKECGIYGALRKNRTEFNNINGSSETVEYSQSQGSRKLPKRKKKELSKFRISKSTMGNTDRLRELQSERSKPNKWGRDSESGEEVDYSMRERYRHPEEEISTGRLRAEPPSPDDEIGWSRALELHPELSPKLPMETEPIIPTLADAVADRVDRVRAIGNGVDPVVAAVAFSTLWYRINGN